MKLNIKNTIFVGIVFLSISLFWQMYDNVISSVLNKVFNLSDSTRGIVMALDNIVALIMLPLFGHLSDKTKSKFGKRTPYIVCGTILAAATFIAVGISADKASLVGFMVALAFTLIFMSVYRSPAVALMPDVTIKPLRSKANAIINLMGALGGLVSLGLIAVLITDGGKYITIFACISGLMLVALVVYLLLVREPKLVQKMEEEERQFGLEKTSQDNLEGAEKLGKAKTKSMLLLLLSVFLWFMAYNAITSSFSVYADKVWNIRGGLYSLPLMVAQVAAIIMFIPVGMLASKIGRKKTILIGIIMMTGAYLLAFFLGSNLFGIKIDFSSGVLNNPMFYLMSILFALCGAGWATINVNSYPMVVEMSRGSTVGKFTGYYYTASMLGQILTPYLSGLLTDNLGRGMLFLYSTIFIILAFITMTFVKHGDNKPLAKSKLESFDIPE